MYNIYIYELYQAVFFNTKCKLQKSVISWTFFYVNYFSHSLYLSRTQEIFHVSRDYRLRYI